MERGPVLNSDDGSRTASLGRKRPREQSDEEQPHHTTASPEPPISPIPIPKRVKVSDRDSPATIDLRIERDGAFSPRANEPVGFEDGQGHKLSPQRPAHVVEHISEQNEAASDPPVFPPLYQSNNTSGSNKIRLEGNRPVFESSADYVPFIDDGALTLGDALLNNQDIDSTKQKLQEVAVDVSSTREPLRQLTKAEKQRVKEYEIIQAQKLPKSATGHPPETPRFLVWFILPQAPGKKRGKKVQFHDATRALSSHIAFLAAEGLVGYYLSPKVPNGAKECRTLLYYANRTQLNSAMTKLQSEPLKVGGATAKIFVAEPSDSNTDGWTSKPAHRRRYGESRALVVQGLLESGRLLRRNYPPLQEVASWEDLATPNPDILNEAENLAHSSSTDSIDDESASQIEESPLLLADITGGELRARLRQLLPMERELQAHYWGLSHPDDLVQCAVCAREGHMAETCPSRTCKNCQARDKHFSSECPTQQKCKKCRERGHLLKDCPSKLARSAADGFSCDLCGESGHVEEECSLLWRTFFPEDVSNLNKVETLSCCCYQCGSDRHWGDDCPLRQKSKRVNVDTFSDRQAGNYLLAPGDPKFKNGEKGICIKGRADNAENFAGEEEDMVFQRGKRTGQQDVLSWGKKAEAVQPSRTAKKHMKIGLSSDISIRGQGSAADLSSRPTQNYHISQPNRGDHWTQPTYYQQQRSRSPEPYDRGYDDYRDRLDANRGNRGSSWQPPLPNKPVSPPRRPSHPSTWRPPLPNEPVPPRRQAPVSKRGGGWQPNQPPQTGAEVAKRQRSKKKREGRP
jgi:hypothetical protein